MSRLSFLFFSKPDQRPESCLYHIGQIPRNLPDGPGQPGFSFYCSACRFFRISTFSSTFFLFKG